MRTVTAPPRVCVPSRDGLAAGPTGIASYPWDVDGPVRWPVHDHGDHELLVVTAGRFTVEVDGIAWIVPPTVGVWIPAGVRHGAAAEAGCRFHCVYVDPACCPVPWDGVVGVRVSGVLVALVSHLAEEDLPEPARRRAEAVVFDLLEPVSTSSIELPMPTDDRARRVALALLDDPADPRSLEGWGAAVGASARTLSRRFVAETGLGFEAWRQQARLRVALAELASGRTVGLAARRVGYRSVSAFVAAFRSSLGETPGEYLARIAG